MGLPDVRGEAFAAAAATAAGISVSQRDAECLKDRDSGVIQSPCGVFMLWQKTLMKAW